jgi:hypothetical protein
MHGALTDAFNNLMTLVGQMDTDKAWAGQHRDEFLAWLDLLRQYLASLIDWNISPAMIAQLKGLLRNLDDYDSASDVLAGLRNVG